jgi:hypothetical protein
MTTGLSYDGTVTGTSSYIDQIANMAVVEVANAQYLITVPQMITYAENRIYKDLDLLSTKTSQTFLLQIGQRSLSLASPTVPYPFVVTEQTNIITPAGATNPDDPASTRNPCLATTKEFLDQVYGSNSTSSRALPTYFAPMTDNTFFFGPPPDQSYTVEIVGTARPASLSSTNKTTFVSLYLPDLFIMASMIYVSAYQRNFSSAASNDPQMPVTYETQYKTLLESSSTEEARKKYQSSAWSSESPTPSATPSRG